MGKHNNVKGKLIGGILAVVLPFLIIQGVIYELLQYGVIKTAIAFVLNAIVAAIAFFIIYNILKALLLPFQAAITGETIRKNSVVAKKMEKLSSRDDEIGKVAREIQSNVETFAETISAIRIATSELEEVSGEFAQMFENMNEVADSTNSAVEIITDNTSIQADKVSDIKKMTEQISEGVDHILNNVESLKQSVDTVLDCNHAASEIMKELVDISEESGHAMEEVGTQTTRTNESAQEIQKVTGIIAGISNQTNLLALNASIEAARAGENGKGFAVVAEQIRELADQSRESTEHISEIVNGLIANSNTSVEITKKVSEAFEKQDEKIKDTESVFGTLNSEIKRVGSAINEIDQEVSDLDEHKNVIAEGVENLAQFAQENAESGRVTKENMDNLGQVMQQCKISTKKIGSVSEKLVEKIKNLKSEGMKKIH